MNRFDQLVPDRTLHTLGPQQVPNNIINHGGDTRPTPPQHVQREIGADRSCPGSCRAGQVAAGAAANVEDALASTASSKWRAWRLSMATTGLEVW